MTYQRRYQVDYWFFRTIIVAAIVLIIAAFFAGKAYGTPAPVVDASADCTAMTVTATNTANQPVTVTLDAGPSSELAPGATQTWTGLSYGRHTVAWSYPNGAAGSKAVTHQRPPDCQIDTQTTSPPAPTVPTGPPTAPPADTPGAPLPPGSGAAPTLPATGGQDVNWMLAVGACAVLVGTLLRVAGVRRP